MNLPPHQEALRFPARMLCVAAMALLCVLWLSPATALTLDARTDRYALSPGFSYLEDPGGGMTLDTVRVADTRFRALDAGDEPNLGYSDAAIWLRSDLRWSGDDGATRMLEIAFPTLDHVAVFLVRERDGKLLHQASAGDHQPFDARPFPHRNFVFPLKLPADEGLRLYLRVASEGSRTVPAYLWSPQAFQLQSRHAYVGFALYFGILVSLLAYNLLLYLSLRDRTYLFYVLFVASMALGQGGWDGFFFEYLWPGSPDWANVTAVVGFNLTGMFGAVFSRMFLATRGQVPWLDRLVVICATAFGLLVLTTPLISYQWNAILTSITGVVFSLVAVVGGILRLRQGVHSARYFLLGWTLLLCGTAALGARNLGLLPTNFFTMYAMQIGSALEMLLLSFALAERINDMRRRKEQAEDEVVKTRRTLLDALKQTEHRLEERVAERTRELVDINDQLLQRQRQLHELAHTDALTGLANRSLLEERLSESLARAAQNGNSLGVMWIDLDDFKPVNDRHGHALGDRALQHIAERLRRGVRSGDTVARMGGDEFVVVLEQVGGVDDVARVAEQLSERVSNPMILEGKKLRVHASLGYALFPEDGSDAQTLLSLADQRMYDNKPRQNPANARRF